MTQFAVKLSKRARHQFDKLDEQLRRRIVEKLIAVQSDPLRQMVRLQGRPYYRLRVGDWRLIAAVDFDTREVVVLEVEHRRSVYRRE